MAMAAKGDHLKCRAKRSGLDSDHLCDAGLTGGVDVEVQLTFDVSITRSPATHVAAIGLAFVVFPAVADRAVNV